MTPEEFKSWFAGFTEALSGPPDDAQWKRICEQVDKIQARPTPSFRAPNTQELLEVYRRAREPDPYVVRGMDVFSARSAAIKSPDCAALYSVAPDGRVTVEKGPDVFTVESTTGRVLHD